MPETLPAAWSTARRSSPPLALDECETPGNPAGPLDRVTPPWRNGVSSLWPMLSRFNLHWRDASIALAVFGD